MKLSSDPENIPIQLKGGGGFGFEDRVAAAFIADLLAGERRFLPSITGRVLAVRWQTGAPPLDDVRLTLGDTEDRGSLSLSIKRDRQVTQKGFPEDFVRAVWSRWRQPGTGEGAFNRERDYLGLAVGLLSDKVLEAWNGLLEQAVPGEPRELARRFSSGSVGKLARDLFASLRCPADLQSVEADEVVERVLLLRRIRLLHFDFRSDPSVDLKRSVATCRRALASGSFDEALDLWERLVGIAAELRPLGGCLELHELLGRLRGKFHLLALTDYGEDREKLRRISSDGLDKVEESLGSIITLLRPERLREIGERLAGRRLLLVGTSGVGKSALVKITCRRWQRGPVLWLDGATADVPGLFALEQRLRLRYPLAIFFRDMPGEGILVLDALETWSPQALQVAAALLRLCASCGNWSVIMTIRPDHPRQLLPDLQRHAELSPGFEPLPILPLEEGELREVLEALPGLKPLFLRPDLKGLLRNLKVLAWLTTLSASDRASEVPGWVKVSEVVDGLWDDWIGTGEDRRLRGELLKKLALREAEFLRQGVGFSELGSEELKALASLEQQEVLKAWDDHAYFQHELAGDWARLRVLIERAAGGSLAADLPGFARSPRWPPAIRLYGERLLEQGDSLTKRWCALYDALPKGAAAEDARGVLLESLFWAGNADEALESLWPRMVADGGELLKRLLRRFLYSATLPAAMAAEFADDERTAAGLRAFVRIPYWPLWKPVLAVLDRHRDDVAAMAPELGAEVCELWLRTVPRQWPWRKEAARVAYRIACETQPHRRGGRRSRGERELKRDQEIYQAALWGAPELPDEVSDFVRELSRRKEEPQEQTRKPKRSPRGMGSIALLGAKKWPVFPDGPRKDVDGGFRAAVLGSQALSGLIECRPEVAREVLLACCLRAPGPDLQSNSFGTIGRFDVRGSAPPMFFSGTLSPVLASQS